MTTGQGTEPRMGVVGQHHIGNRVWQGKWGIRQIGLGDAEKISVRLIDTKTGPGRIRRGS